MKTPLVPVAWRSARKALRNGNRPGPALARRVADSAAPACGVRGDAAGQDHEAARHDEATLQEQLAAVAAAVPGLLFTLRVDAGGHTSFPFASRGVEDLFGVSAHMLVADAAVLRARFHPDDLPRFMAHMAASARTLALLRIELRAAHPGKGQRWIEIRATPQRQPDGATEWHGLMIDISERKAMEENLIASEQQFRSLAENSPDPIYRYDRACRRLYVNRAVGTIVGMPVTELIGGAPADGKILAPEQNLKVTAAIGEVFTSGNTHHIDVELVDRDGRRRDYHMAMVPERSADGTVATVLALARDLTATRDAERRLAHLSANVPGFVFSFRRAPDGHCSFPYISAGIASLYGLQPEDVHDDMAPLHALAHPDDRPGIEAAVAEAARTLAPMDLVFRICRPGHPQRWLESRSIPQREDDGAIVWHGFMSDVTARKEIEEALHKRSEEYRALTENVPDIIIRYDRACRRVYVNPMYERSARLSEASCLGKTPLEWWDIPTYPAATFQRQLQQVLASGETAETEFDWVRQDGKRMCFHLTIVAERDSAQRIVSVLTIGRDIGTIKVSQEALAQNEREFRELAENSLDTIARYDRHCRLVYANPRLIEDSGGELARIQGATPAQFPGGLNGHAYEAKIRQVVEQRASCDFELYWGEEGNERCSHIRMRPEFDGAGQVARVLAVGRDITEIDRYRKTVQRQAFYDDLTGLPNRALLFKRLGQEIAATREHGRCCGLIILDLDHFKAVNDTLGHCAGDRLLCEVAQRLKFAVRAGDTVARLGGDEFGIVLPEVGGRDDLGAVAAKVLKALAEPIMLDGGELFVSCSIGIALCPDDSVEMGALLKYADTAMYFAKKQGRNNFQFYAAELNAHSAAKLELEAALRKAAAKGELVLHYQPQVDLPSGDVIGAEALLRWNRPEHGMVPPDQFIPIAEESGLIVEIGEWVLASACAVVADWNRSRERAVTMAVNVSTRQFLRNDLVGSVRRILADSGCKPEWLKLEITESVLLEDSVEVARMLEALDCMGVAISIDDFGTGYSALSYLSRFPVAQLKIDRSFVQDIPHERRQCELVKAMLSIAAALQLQVVAEGVETQAQADYLGAQGCRLAQGYLFGKPMPRASFETLLSEPAYSACAPCDGAVPACCATGAPACS